MKHIKRDEVQKAATRRDMTLVEVLDKDEYDTFHLPGAVNVPLDEQFDERIQAAVPDKSESVVVYCQDANCPASTKAANRMEALGYENVFEYDEGKTDWKQAGLPVVEFRHEERRLEDAFVDVLRTVQDA